MKSRTGRGADIARLNPYELFLELVEIRGSA